MDQLQTEEDLRELLMLTTEYLESIKKDEQANTINELIVKQKKKSLQDPIDPNDEALQILKSTVNFSTAQ